MNDTTSTSSYMNSSTAGVPIDDGTELLDGSTSIGMLLFDPSFTYTYIIHIHLLMTYNDHHMKL
jgi:hypothetical protein